MKKILFLCLALSMLMLAACSPAAETTDPTPTQGTATTEPTAAPTEEVVETEAPAATADPNAAPTDLFYSSDVSELEGTWNLAQVYVGGETADAVDGAATLSITFSLDPSELVDDAAYIHNQVYNLTGDLTFGVAAIQEALSAEGVDGYRGSTAWSDFPQGEVVAEGEFYKQPGPATMRFKDIDICGLFLEELSGIGADVDTTERTLIIGLNNQGQLLLGYSDEHLERPGTEGEWVYCLIFDKAA